MTGGALAGDRPKGEGLGLEGAEALAAGAEGRRERRISVEGERECFRHAGFGGSFSVWFCL